MTQQEAYKLLNISETANIEQIKQAYKKQAKKYHPDIYRGDKKFAEEKMKQINEAYTTLSMPCSSNSNYSYHSNNSSTYNEYMRAKKEHEEHWKKVYEDLEKMQKEKEEQEKQMKKMFKPIFILLIISLVIGFIFLFTTLITSVILHFNQANWFSFGFNLVWIIVAIPFCFVCFAAFIWMWEKMFK